MPSLFPTQVAIGSAFANATPFDASRTSAAKPATSSKRARPDLYSAWSVADDAKQKTAQLSDAAAKEFNKASNAAQAKTGHIELYSAQYYAACTFGGMLACVGIR